MRTAVAGALIFSLAACDGWGAYPPEASSWETFELWSVRPDGSDRHRVFADFNARRSVVELVGTSGGSDPVFVSLSNQGLLGVRPSEQRLVEVLALEGAASFTISPDGFSVAFVRNQNELWLASIDGSEIRPLVRDSVWLNQLRWLPDGRSVAYARTPPFITNRKQGGVWIVGVDDSSSKRLTHTATIGFDILADRSAVVFAADTTTTTSGWQRPTNVFLQRTDEPEPVVLAPGGAPQFTPDGRQIIFLAKSLGRSPIVVHVSDLTGFNQRPILTASRPIRQVPVITSDGRSLIVRTLDKIIGVDLSSGESTLLSRSEDHEKFDDREWTGFMATIGDLILARDDSQIYYFLTSRFYYEPRG